MTYTRNSSNFAAQVKRLEDMFVFGLMEDHFRIFALFWTANLWNECLFKGYEFMLSYNSPAYPPPHRTSSGGAGHLVRSDTEADDRVRLCMIRVAVSLPGI